jgi:hypothetical protein
MHAAAASKVAPWVFFVRLALGFGFFQTQSSALFSGSFWLPRRVRCFQLIERAGAHRTRTLAGFFLAMFLPAARPAPRSTLLRLSATDTSLF